MTSLVLLTGLPATGKSTVAQRLAEDRGFAILSTDDLRQSLFREDYGETRENGKAKEEIVRKVLDYSKLQLLLEGYDLVIDASAPTDKFRRRMLELPEDFGQVIKKYLLHMRSDEQIIYSRQKARGRTKEAIEAIRGYWQKPQDGLLGSRLVEVENNDGLNQLYGKLRDFMRA